jgi:GNAT superfamily N-acetyltransferase
VARGVGALVDLHIRGAQWTTEEARRLIEIHRQSVRDIPTHVYDAALIEEWAPWPITPESVERFIKRHGTQNSLVWLAETPAGLVGWAELVLQPTPELRSLFVDPSSKGLRVGARLAQFCEQRAQELGYTHLGVGAALSAVDFYLKCGFEKIEPAIYTLSSGRAMPIWKMRKQLNAY